MQVSVTVAKAYFLRVSLKTKKSLYTTKSDSEQGDSHHPSVVSYRRRSRVVVRRFKRV